MWAVACFEFFASLLIRAFIGRVAKRRPSLTPYAVAFAVASGLSIGIDRSTFLTITAEFYG